MKVAVLQTDIMWGRVDDNISAVERLMSVAGAAELYVLPEMWATGFAATSPDEACSEVPLDWMIRTACERFCAVCGSVAVRDDGGIFRNRHYFVMPDGSYHYYDKRHLFTYGGEDRHYARGEDRVVVEYKNVRFLLQTCYDLRFPVWSRNTGDYDAIIYVANWPESRQNVWQILLRARAMENQCYVIGANRVGRDALCLYKGGSAVIDARGYAVAGAVGSDEQVVTADISLDDLCTFRKKFPVLNDRDAFEVK